MPFWGEIGVADVQGTDEWCLLIPVKLCGGVGSGVAGAGVCTHVSFCFDLLIWDYLLLVVSWVWVTYLG